MNSKPTVLITGISGVLGTKIANAVLDKGEMNVRGLVRSPSNDKLNDLKARGVEFVAGDLFDSESLPKACEGVETIISAVKGNISKATGIYREDIVLSGQLNLLEAAIKSGVKRFVPSDYSVDYFNLDLGDNYNLDFRKKFAELLKQSGMDHTFILNGAFTDGQLQYAGLFDFDQGTFSYWGDGNQPCDFTTYDDTAKYVAEVIADPEMVNQALKVAGDVLTMKQLLAAYEAVTGKKLEEKQLGSTDDLQAVIATAQETAKTPMDYVFLQYHWAMVTGKGKLDELHNDRYPQISPTSIQQFIASMEV